MVMVNLNRDELKHIMMLEGFARITDLDPHIRERLTKKIEAANKRAELNHISEEKWKNEQQKQSL